MTVRSDFLATQTLGTDPAHRVTTFLVAEKVAGRQLGLDARAGSLAKHVVLHAEPGSFNTIILEQSGGNGAPGLTVVPVVDNTDFNQSRAGGLLLDPNGPAVFADVTPGAAKARSVNPVAAPVRATCGGQSAPTFALEGMEAGGMYSVWLMQPGQALTAFMSRDTTAKWKP